jgi:hypothetical protein
MNKVILCFLLVVSLIGFSSFGLVSNSPSSRSKVSTQTSLVISSKSEIRKESVAKITQPSDRAEEKESMNLKEIIISGFQILVVKFLLFLKYLITV